MKTAVRLLPHLQITREKFVTAAQTVATSIPLAGLETRPSILASYLQS